MAAPRERLALGLISGTSQDAVDGVLAAFDEQGRLLGLRGQGSRPYPAELRSRLLALGFENQALTLAEYAACDRAVADAFAETAEAVLEAAGVRAAAVTVIGSHGQTVFHEPRRIASSLQLGDPNRLAARLGCPVVADFRRADIARGGQGAPLVCAL
ncbi:MAG TPA: anhydro-N-acetylmuramic acid kinase, partial [Nevskiaceae bacterium]|nr:anhydro-N-acetylmuramic acid kinase [Nevskiaceae bacterium]